MKFRLLVALGSVCITPSALGCSPLTSGYFEPTLEPWFQHPGPRQIDSSSEGDYWEALPAPIVSVVRISRGTQGADPGDCSDIGWLELRVSLPESSTYELEEFGVYFRVVGGTGPDSIFPDLPLVAFPEKGEDIYTFSWLDRPPQNQVPINLEVEVFLVTNGMNLGPTARFTLVAGAGPA